jgi:hypothetical protein
MYMIAWKMTLKTLAIVFCHVARSFPGGEDSCKFLKLKNKIDLSVFCLYFDNNSDCNLKLLVKNGLIVMA